LTLYGYNVEPTNPFCEDRGVIKLNGGDQRTVCKSFPYTPEIISNEDLHQDLLTDDIVKSSDCYTSFEGTIVRLFEVDNKWFLSTHRKINAFKSRWSEEITFGDLFLKALHRTGKVNVDELNPILNRNYVYTFLIRNTIKNRLVCDPCGNSENPVIYYTGSFNRTDNFSFVWDDNFKIFERPEKLSFSSKDDIIAYVSKSNYKKNSGVIVYHTNPKTNKIQPIKITNPEYKYYASLRGNEPNIILRYIKMRGHPFYIDFIELYKEHEDKFTNIEKLFYKSINNITIAYVNRYIKKQYVELPQCEFYIMKKCHQWHLQDKTHNKINIDRVREIFDNYDPYILYRIYKLYDNYN